MWNPCLLLLFLLLSLLSPEFLTPETPDPKPVDAL